ncbi:NAD(P)H-binding protein [Chryseobacterium arthrosphaerae]|uniref:NAD(P)H-binding protein n=1 Tax=Chryseobacterium arthrosphaerae TaxID=651561 RepID=UPI001E41BA4E|nr:NAD(P)H-binding protein [Chryseobacterium arthrosphaerae]UEQ77582.1 NAD(P)H-binding protein [Chryseobacterium arthrosphaerae]
MNTNILVIGGGGKNGRRVVEKIKNRGGNIFSTTRVKEKADDTIRFFDWNHPETYHQALENIDKVYIVHPDTSIPQAYDQISELTEAMTGQNVSKAVLLSGRGQESVEKCEKVLMDSSLQWVIIRSAWFNQNFSEGHFLHGIKSGEVTFLAGTVKEPFVDLEDLSDAVVEVLIHEEHNEKIYEVTGEELLTFEEAVERIGLSIGRQIQYNAVDKNEYFEGLISAGLDTHVAKHLVWTFGEILDGRNQNTGNGIRKILGRKPKSFLEFVQTNKFI